jgi:hypothetical protein
MWEPEEAPAYGIQAPFLPSVQHSTWPLGPAQAARLSGGSQHDVQAPATAVSFTDTTATATPVSCDEEPGHNVWVL